MARASRTFRIFVSSTFDDLKEERNALQKQVFPKLRELCLQNGCRFQAIDLRWGVSEEAALDQQTMKICLEEIARCQQVTPRPNFIVLLGDRYGWRPAPAEIPADEFEEIEGNIAEFDDREFLHSWYKLDENAARWEGRAVHGVYILKPREREFEDENAWETVEKRLRKILRIASAKANFSAEQRIKYSTSATEQEIYYGALSPKLSNAEEYVFCFFRKMANLDDLESDLDKPPSHPDTHAKNFVDHFIDEGKRQLDFRTYKNLVSLKERKLKPTLQKNIYHYSAKWTGDGITLDHIGELPDTLEACLKLNEDSISPSNLCVDVWRRLSGVILKEVDKLEKKDPLEQEIAAHNTFDEDRAKFFTGRTPYLQAIGKYIRGSDRHPFAIFGEPGSGKTALIAKALEYLDKAHRAAAIVSRFIGSTPNSSDGRSLLESLCRQISRAYNADEADIPSDYKDLVTEFPKRLSLATPEKPLLILLDALDQLSDTDSARNLVWLPKELPENVRLVVSTLPGECLSILERKTPDGNRMELKPMSASEGSKLLDLWLHDAGRKLQDDQREEVLSKFEQLRLPLYLKLAFEEAKLWKSYAQRVQLSKNISGVIRDLLKRLCKDDNHGKIIVSRSLGYLAAAKNGLAEDEMLDVLSLDKDVFRDFTKRAKHTPPEPRLPAVIWSRLYFDLEPYLTERSADGTTLLAFYHREIRDMAVGKYLTDEADINPHSKLADYFIGRTDKVQVSQPFDLSGDTGDRMPNLRKISELPFQLVFSMRMDELYQLLTDFSFLEEKAATEKHVSRRVEVEYVYYDGIYNLIEDFDLALEHWSAEKDFETIEKQRKLDAIRGFLLEKAHILSRYPEILFQGCYNHTSIGPLAQVAEGWLERNKEYNLQWLKRLNRPDYTAQGTRLLGHNNAICSCAFADSGRLLVSVAETDPVYVWDIETSRLIFRIELEKQDWFYEKGAQRKVRRRPFIRDVAATDRSVGLLDRKRIYLLSPDDWQFRIIDLSEHGKCKILAASKNHYFAGIGGQIWVLENSGTIIQRILENEWGDTIDSITVTASGSWLASIDYNGLLILSQLQNGKYVVNAKWVLQFDKESDELFLRSIDSWDLRKQNYSGSNFSLSLSPNGRYLAVSVDRYIQVFNLKRGKSICRHKNDSYLSWFANVSPDGKRVVFAGDWIPSLRTLGVLDIASDSVKHLLIQSGEHLMCTAFSPDGRFLVVGTEDGSLSIVKADKALPLNLMNNKNQLATDDILGSVVSFENRKVASWSIDHYVSVWGLAKGALILSIGPLGRGGNDRIILVGFSPKSEYMYVKQGMNKDARLRIWKIKSGKNIFDTEHHFSKFGQSFDYLGEFYCGFSFDDTTAVVAGRCCVFVIDLELAEVTRKVPFKLNPLSDIKLHIDDIGNVFAVIQSRILKYEKNTFVCRHDSESFVEDDSLEHMEIPVYDTIPSFQTKNLYMKKPKILGFVDDILPGQKQVAELYEKGKILGRFDSGNKITYVGVIPGTKKVLVGNSNGDLSILVYETQGTFSGLVNSDSFQSWTGERLGDLV